MEFVKPKKRFPDPVSGCSDMTRNAFLSAVAILYLKGANNESFPYRQHNLHDHRGGK